MNEDPDHPGVFWPDDDEDPPAWWLERTRRRAMLTERAVAAADEDAPAEVVIWCAESACGTKGAQLGQVRRSSVGLVFDAYHPVQMEEDQRRRLLDDLRGSGAGRLPFPITRSRCAVLLDDPPAGDEPAVHCPRCGAAELDRDQLRGAARRQGARPARLSIRCGGGASG